MFGHVYEFLCIQHVSSCPFVPPRNLRRKLLLRLPKGIFKLPQLSIPGKTPLVT